MHFFKKSVSFLAVMCVCGAAYSAARVAMTTPNIGTAASRRLASLSNVVKSNNTVANTSGTSSSSTTANPLLSDAECIEEYRSCMKADNACGSDFEECTTNVLFHGHMGECFSTLYQCSSTAINSLFGVSNISALSSVSSYVDGTNQTEIARYTYPTDGSVMGIDIIGAATRNKLSTADCVKKYKNCLTKDNVCGEDFELCTSEDEFKKQAVMCDSTLSRCQKEGFQQLFGEKVMTKPANNKLKPTDGDTYKWMTDGATLAAANAVNTCYKVIDSCFVNACAKNPYRCVEGVTFGVLGTADFVADQSKSSTIDEANVTETQTASSVRKFYRAACQDTIGSNQYCYMTFKAKTPSKKDLTDPDTREEIFDEAYSTRNKKDIIGVKVTDMVEKFDKTAKDKCIETFKTCAIRSCGGGSGAACYSRVFGGKDMTGSINKGNTYKDIVRGCTAAVNTDANCKYMAATLSAEGNVYNYTYSDDGAFDALFPEYTNTGDDKVPVVAALNADLSTAYNDAAIAQLKKQCGNVVSNCVKSMCGSNYQNCYRNRNDISLATYNTTSDGFNKSMNKVGGVLDYTIVQGLCALTVKNSDVCAESLAIAKMGIADGEADVRTGWGNETNVGSAWRTSANDQYMQDVQEVNQDGKHICECGNSGTNICDYEEGGVSGCSTPHMISKSIAQENSAINTVFKDVLVDVEMEAQAQYKAKLTKEQNICLAQNSGANPNATFVWAKLKSKMKSDYGAKGLGENGSVQSNDLYNSFCRVKITVMSEDKDIQNALGGETNAYFSTGDPFTCGSWISDNTIKTVTDKVGERARKEAGEGSQKDKNTDLWVTLGSGVFGAGLSAWGMDSLQSNASSSGLGGLLNKNMAKANSAEECTDQAKKAREAFDAAVRSKSQTKMDEALRYARTAKAKLSSVDSNKASMTIPTSVTLNTIKGAVTREGRDAVAAVDAKYGLQVDEANGVSQLITKVSTLCDFSDASTDPTDYPGCVNNATAASNLWKSISERTYNATGSVAELATIQNYLNAAKSHLDKFWKAGRTKSGTTTYTGSDGKTYTKSTVDTYYNYGNGVYTKKNCSNFGGYTTPSFIYNPAQSVVDGYCNGLPDTISVTTTKGGGYAYNGPEYNNFRSEVAGLPAAISALRLNVIETEKGQAYVAAVSELRDPDTYEWDSTELANLSNTLSELETTCENVATDNKESGAGKRLALDAGAAVVGGGLTSLLAHDIVSTAQKAKYENAENEAIKEWMENIGSKIHCYVGGEPVGDYGDIISVDISEE
ncbi:MAG: hypothetical protein IKP24_02710 [Alphaproteobacteria bacterium]|nr:hypothetical protein [Alphaproteobacteria bacterium]